MTDLSRERIERWLRSQDALPDHLPPVPPQDFDVVEFRMLCRMALRSLDTPISHYIPSFMISSRGSRDD